MGIFRLIGLRELNFKKEKVVYQKEPISFLKSVIGAHIVI